MELNGKFLLKLSLSRPLPTPQILQLQMNDFRYHYMFTTFVSLRFQRLLDGSGHSRANKVAVTRALEEALELVGVFVDALRVSSRTLAHENFPRLFIGH
jgi:hypothetical protein